MNNLKAGLKGSQLDVAIFRISKKKENCVRSGESSVPEDVFKGNSVCFKEDFKTLLV